MTLTFEPCFIPMSHSVFYWAMHDPPLWYIGTIDPWHISLRHAAHHWAITHPFEPCCIPLSHYIPIYTVGCTPGSHDAPLWDWFHTYLCKMQEVLAVGSPQAVYFLLNTLSAFAFMHLLVPTRIYFIYVLIWYKKCDFLQYIPYYVQLFLPEVWLT